ncbi:hypothetical protein [Marinomonas communis]|uniref:Uncharacterized protein n=1 Tax=Marinomonas communis TaxID=28254 RepID=A0A4R6X6X9_9GAMM|nr:hypothetical protein [Marinomonas communis]TDR12473.1 hypothetical protein C8D85_2508 [Marinomonas communis]
MPREKAPLIEFYNSPLHRFLQGMKIRNLTIDSMSAKRSRQFILSFCHKLLIPPHLRAIDLAMENMLNSCENLMADCDDISLLEAELGTDLRDVRLFAEFMLDNIDLARMSGAYIWFDVVFKSNEKPHPMAQQWGTYPIYSMLVTSSEDESYELALSALQLIAISAYVSVCNTHQHLFDYVNDQAKCITHLNSSASSASCYIRQFSDNTIDGEELDYFSGEIVIYHWCLEITSSRNDSVTEERPEYRKQLSPLISKWTSFQLLRKSSKHSGSRNKAKPYNRKASGWHGGYYRYHSGIISEDMLIDDNESSYFSDKNKRTSTSITTFKLKKLNSLMPFEELKYADLEDDEQGDYDELISVDDPTPTNSNILSKRQLSQIIRSNQHLSFQYSTATNTEIAQLVALCMDIIRSPISHDDDRVTYAAPIALLMLYSGCSLSDVVLRTRWTNDNVSTKAKLTSILEDNQRKWLLKISTVERKKTLTDSILEQCRQVQPYFKIPDEFGIAECLEKQHSEQLKSAEKGRIFKKRLKDYRPMLNSLLKKLPSGNRLNEHKIANFLPIHITHQTGDVALSILTTGQYVPLGKTLLHYSAPSPSLLEHVRQKVWQDLCKAIPLPSTIQDAPENDANDTTHAVSPLCPSYDSVLKMVRCTKGEISRYRASAKVHELHNLITYYTAQMFAYGTGVRAICSPMISLDTFDSRSGTVVISDKDGEDFYNSRLCILPRRVSAQLDLYKRHVEQLKTNSYFQAMNLNYDAQVPEFFYLDDHGHPTEIKPSISFALQEKFFQLPLNSNRRLIRTYLMEQKVSGELINAFMGHWGMGQEPWGKFSSCSPFELIEAVSPYIDQLLQVLGFEVVEGLNYVRYIDP